jgi:hypothetical protein
MHENIPSMPGVDSHKNFSLPGSIRQDSGKILEYVSSLPGIGQLQSESAKHSAPSFEKDSEIESRTTTNALIGRECAIIW